MKNKTPDEFAQEVIKDVIDCGTQCADIGSFEVDVSKMDIDFLIENLPGLDYTKDRLLNYIFSNGLTTGEVEANRRLDYWLYDLKNRQGATNFSVLREAVGYAIIYGECGVRIHEDRLYIYRQGHFGALVNREDGIDEIVAFFIRKDGKEVEGDFKLDQIVMYSSVERFFDDNNMILLDTSEFFTLRNDITQDHGYCPLRMDQQRISLLMSVYMRLNYDINYDGPGRIVVRPKSGYLSGEENDMSTSAMFNNTPEAQRKRNENAQAEVRRVANQIKGSSSDSVILLSNAFEDKIEKIPRVTKATEFFEWLKGEGVILAELLGMSPTLLEVGDIHGNVSVEKIIDNAMLNTIIPMRESYAVQFSEAVSKAADVPKVYFNKYDMQQVEDENDIRAKVAGIIRDLSVATKNTEDENVHKLLNEFTEVLRTSVYDDNGNLREL